MTSPTLLPTGVPLLNALLGGGLVLHAFTLLVGTPGAGKTVLASQIAFSVARQNLPVVILTSYSEGNTKYLSHIREFSFFDSTFIQNQIHLYALSSIITDDFKTTNYNITQVVKKTGARLLYIDGLQAIMNGALQLSVRPLLASLATQSTYLNLTVLATLTGIPRTQVFDEEMTVADTAIGLDYRLDNGQHVRSIEIIKQRGLSQLPGAHPYRITNAGIEVHPQLEILPTPAAQPFTDGRKRFDLPEFDTLLGGGLTPRTTTTLAGAPGTGKTTLGLYWALQDATPEAQSLFVSFGEFPEQIEMKATAFGLPLAEKMASGAVQLVHMDEVPPQPDLVATHLLSYLSTAPIQRVVIDDVSILLRALGSRSNTFLMALRNQFYLRGVTSLFLLEIPPLNGFQFDLANIPIGVVAENLIVVQQFAVNNVLRRFVAVLRMRFSDHDRTLRELVLEPGNIRVLRPEETQAQVLNQAAESSGGIAPS